MLKVFQCCAILFLSLFLFNGLAYSANEQFRSIATGNWNANPTWEMSTDGGSTWIPATSTPRDTSGLITVRSPNTVTVTANVSADQLTVNNGATLSINAAVLLTILNGSGDDLLVIAGGTVSGAGTVQTQGNVTMIIRNGSNFNAALKVNTGTTTSYDDQYPYIGIYKGTLTIDAGATFFTQGGGYSNQVNGAVINNGTIAGDRFIMRGSTLANNNSISTSNLQFDSTTSLSGTGTYTSSSISIGVNGNVSLANNVTFSSTTSGFTIKTGGILNPNTKIFTFNSGSFIIENGGTVSNSGIFQTQGSVTMIIRNGSNFNAALKVNTGTTTSYNDQYPYIGIYKGTLTIDAGATFTTQGGGYSSQVNGAVINNGTIAGDKFIMRGSTLANNNSISTSYLQFDSTTSLSGTGTYTSSAISIGGSGNVSLANNVTFSPTSSFTIKTGGILNPNTRTLTLTSGTFTIENGGTVSNSGIFQTQGSVTMIIRNGSNFNAALKVNTGTTTSYDDQSPYIGIYKGTLTIDAGATFTTQGGGYSSQVNGAVINNGAIAGDRFIMRGSTLANNSSISTSYLQFDSTTSLSGTGTYTSSAISIGVNGNVSLANNVTFSPTSSFTIKTGGILNPNTKIFTFNSGTFIIENGGTVSNSGIFQTQGSVSMIIRNGSNFNAALKVNTGTTTSYDDQSPYIAIYKGTLTIDAGATLTTPGGYSNQVNGAVINNGTIAGTKFIMRGSTLANNGLITVAQFNFESITALTGTGTWSTTANMTIGSVVTLLSNHQMHSVNINTGGTFNITNFILKLSATDPITQNGTFTVTNSTVEYNGALAQTISTTNITYHRLKINNTTGTSLFGNVTVNDTLSVLLGDLDLNGKILTLSSAGYLTETTGNTVKGTSGYITTIRNISAPSALNVAGLGAVLTTNANLGNTEIKRGHTVQTGLNGGTSIERYFDITPANNTGLDATLAFKYDDSELNGKPETSLKLYSSTNAGTNWVLAGGTPNALSNTITLMKLNSFSRWTADSSSVSMVLTVIMEGFYNPLTNSLNMRDTVRAYLRNNSSPFAIVDSAKSVIDMTTLTGAYNFPNATSGRYYIQVKHRNSIETWSRTGGEIYSVGSTLNYNFTTAAAKAFGDNMKQVDISPVRFGIFSGDVNQDGVIDGTDAALIDNDAANFATGYKVTDLNGDQIIDGSDASIVDNNAANFVSKITP